MDSDGDNPFTLPTFKPPVTGIKKHEITIKHEHLNDTPPPSTSPDNPVLIPNSSTEGTKKDEIKRINEAILVIDEIMSTYEPEDSEYVEFKLQKRQILKQKLYLINPSSDDTATPGK